MPFNKSLFLLLLILPALLLNGCGDSTLDDPIGQLGTDTNSRVPHQSWGSYRLYNYVDGNFRPIVDLGQPLGDRPTLGERPVLVIHGLGSSISGGRFNDMAQNLLANGATSVFGFEYDSLDPVSTNGTFLSEALSYLTTDEQNRSFRFVAHSMGGLVARTQFESGTSFSMQPTDNLVSFLAVPHLGSEIAGELAQGPSNIVEQALAQIILNGELLFFNADGTPVDVTGDEPSFAELAPNSTFLEALNAGASTSHPQFNYRTIAGNDRGDDYEAFNQILGIFADDGVVNVESANAEVIGPLARDIVPFDHSAIVEAQAAILLALNQLGLL